MTFIINSFTNYPINNCVRCHDVHKPRTAQGINAEEIQRRNPVNTVNTPYGLAFWWNATNPLLGSSKPRVYSVVAAYFLFSSNHLAKPIPQCRSLSRRWFRLTLLSSRCGSNSGLVCAQSKLSPPIFNLKLFTWCKIQDWIVGVALTIACKDLVWRITLETRLWIIVGWN